MNSPYDMGMLTEWVRWIRRDDGTISAVSMDFDIGTEGLIESYKLIAACRKNRRIDATEVGEYQVSTVFLDDDRTMLCPTMHPHCPVLFETMVFPSNRAWHARTEPEARELHEAIVKLLREAIARGEDIEDVVFDGGW